MHPPASDIAIRDLPLPCSISISGGHDPCCWTAGDVDISSHLGTPVKRIKCWLQLIVPERPGFSSSQLPNPSVLDRRLPRYSTFTPNFQGCPHAIRNIGTPPPHQHRQQCPVTPVLAQNYWQRIRCLSSWLFGPTLPIQTPPDLGPVSERLTGL